ncbi:MAG: Hsp20/alpha crystallin family protein [Gammaproteobacteria bacterium]|nr:Hsp20/alpha crystallin family protein [Gammaproteobacteria bacterium]MCP4088534.1 Hsp20/alpha crystallin family protein [Gammaproteobacteria bacterium]MCP4276726.1 Hsp20/alpha crystallin family protein [Gammaproteobacteria bacterium]MCP4832435.1 Hsp20/alpha crystallin family protein [Gammaproteobacteria bacterium]MCP4929876.1 Hsp20/alpha crystallin family protein [Gammaproteobacteria bacterium]
MNITHYTSQTRPLSLLGRLLQEQEMDGSLRNISEAETVTDWLPAVDIREESDRFILHADLPGVNPDAIEIAMEDGTLTIQGSRQSENTEEPHGYKRFERINGRFLRRFALPDTANDEDISAEVHQGVLEVTIPKQPKPQPRKITVRSAK